MGTCAITLQISRETRKAFKIEWRRACQAAHGDLHDRLKVNCQNVPIDNTIITEVDRLMMEKWAKLDKSIWTLNQCYYVGARTVQLRTRQQRNTKQSENLQTKLEQAVGRKRKKVMDARSKLGKLVSEGQRRATKGKLKGKLRRNLLNLKLAGVSTRSLKVRITQMRELVKIRKSQLETVDTRLKYAK